VAPVVTPDAAPAAATAAAPALAPAAAARAATEHAPSTYVQVAARAASAPAPAPAPAPVPPAPQARQKKQQNLQQYHKFDQRREQQNQTQQHRLVESGERAARVDVADSAQLFRSGKDAAPLLAALKGDALANLKIYCELPTVKQVRDFREANRLDMLPDDWLSSKTVPVRKRHLSALRMVQHELTTHSDIYATLSFGEAVVKVYRDRQRQRKWRATTLTRELNSLAGAMSDLVLYSQSPVGYSLSDDAKFKDAQKAAQLAANEELVASQPAMTAKAIDAAISQATDVATKAALALDWMCCGRMSDVMSIKRAEVELAENFQESGEVVISFCRGKGARLSQPYAVATRCPPSWRPWLEQFITTFLPTEWIFPNGHATTAKDASRALQEIEPGVTVRAIRRGALQTLANRGVNEADIMTFSGHASTDGLSRYLRWGLSNKERKDAGFKAAALLDPRQPEDDSDNDE
jgi:hypothetical protein